jgi:transposase-like protein
MYIQGVSTRKVNAILSELCGFEVTSSEVSRAIQELDVQLAVFKMQRFWLPMAFIWKARERF